MPDPEQCLCRGSGWALSDVDTWHQCPIHYKNQRHPEDYHDDLPESTAQSNEDLIAMEFKEAANESIKPLSDDGIPF